VSDLLVTTHTPVLRSGQAVRTYGVARALAAHGGLTLLYARFGAEQPDQSFRSIPGIELREVIASRGLGRGLAYARARMRGVPEGFARGASAELSARAAELAEAPNRGRVIADGPIAATALAGLARRRPVIYNAHNLESSFRHELQGSTERTQGTLRRFERALLARSQESWMVSRADLLAAHELCPTARLRYVPNVVDVAEIQPITTPPGVPRATFVANFSYEPNRNALSFLVEQVFPRVWEELADARLQIVGGGLHDADYEDDRVEALGFVEHLRDAYSAAACAVVPLLQGGGSPLKFVEALAYGLPVVATSRAAAGLDVSDGENCLIANGAEAFAAALVQVLRGQHPRLGAAGRQLAEHSYSIEALSELLASPAQALWQPPSSASER
jgi:glycosyltransferase involved in cell wall biosynthesis